MTDAPRPSPTTTAPLPESSTAGSAGKHIAADIPPLAADKAFWAMTTTQFLGAFNDNLFKQLVLLLSVVAGSEVVAGIGDSAASGSAKSDSEDLQFVAMLVFSVPFLLFSGLAGFLADRHSKRVVIISAKAAEIVIMLMGMAAFLMYDMLGLTALLVVLFLMGTHSAFFGPSKYGILPEMLHARDLPAANGVIQMTTFVAIILGMALAGGLKELFGAHLWGASLVCVGIAVTGTMTSLGVRRVPVANPQLKFTPAALFVPKEMLLLLRRDGPLCAALFASCMFWLVAGMVQPSVNALGIKQLGLGDGPTSLMAAAIALGIAVGCMSAGLLSRGRVSRAVVSTGAWGVVVCLGTLALPAFIDPQLFGAWTSSALLAGAGFFAGMFAVPIQVFLQSRPPQDQKGRMIATMNIANWLAIVVSAVLYGTFDAVANKLGWEQSSKFAFTAAIMIPIALLYRPADQVLRDNSEC